MKLFDKIKEFIFDNSVPIIALIAGIIILFAMYLIITDSNERYKQREIEKIQMMNILTNSDTLTVDTIIKYRAYPKFKENNVICYVFELAHHVDFLVYVKDKSNEVIKVKLHKY